MLIAEMEDIEELARTLRDIRKTMSWFQGNDHSPERRLECQKLVLSFHTTASMLGLEGLARVGQELEVFLGDWVPGNGKDRAMLVLGEQLEALSGRLESVEDLNTIGELDSSVVQMIQFEEKSGAEEELSTAKGSTPAPLELERLERIVTGLGGALTYTVADAGPGTIVLKFDALPPILDRIETLLSPWDPDPEICLAPQLASSDPKTQRIIEIVKEFMKALSEGLWDKSQEILLELSEQNNKSNLYQEIGVLARQLHSALKDVTATLDPGLTEMVEMKLLDSENRLEHILELTERAANVTLDNVELIQKRNQEAGASLASLRETVTGLRALSSSAQEKLDIGLETINAVRTVFDQNGADLISILTAQDFQDLTGQIIQKIIRLLKDLEQRLVHVVRVFGGRRIVKKAAVQEEELYGPAHKGKEEALHSQDDVDSLLAEFGF